MIEGKKVLAIIPARGGSKGIPRKNVRDVAGKPLIAWTIEEAKKSAYIDRLILSSEDPEIIEAARSWGCEVPFVRPMELAQDETPGIEPVLHALNAIFDYDIVVLLQVTSPGRTVADIDGCIDHLVRHGANSCVSLTKAKENPYWMFKVGARGVMQPVIPTDQIYSRRQDLPQTYILNGAVYVARSEWLREHKTFVTDGTLGFVMPNERSLDIDTEQDLQKFLQR
jgi:CMP-N,N'-diacetyllegionaminic acid synthase